MSNSDYFARRGQTNGRPQVARLQSVNPTYEDPASNSVPVTPGIQDWSDAV